MKAIIRNPQLRFACLLACLPPSSLASPTSSSTFTLSSQPGSPAPAAAATRRAKRNQLSPLLSQAHIHPQAPAEETATRPPRRPASKAPTNPEPSDGSGLKVCADPEKTLSASDGAQALDKKRHFETPRQTVSFSPIRDKMDFSQQQQQQQQDQQQQQQQQHSHGQATYAGLSLGTLPDATQHFSAMGGWYSDDPTMQPSINVQRFRSTGPDAVDNMTTWTPSYASVGGNDLTSAYSASLADIVEEGDVNMGGMTSAARTSDQVAYDPLISDTYDLPQFGQSMAQPNTTAALGFQGGGNGLDFSTLLGGMTGWNQSAQQGGQGNVFASGGGGPGGRGPSSDAGQSTAFLSTHASPDDSSMSPDASSTSARPGTGGGMSNQGNNAGSFQNPGDLVALWARSASIGQDKLNMALDQVHISDETRYQPVFAEDNEAPSQPQAARTDHLRASLPTLNTTFGGMSMDLDGAKAGENGPKSADIAAALAAWASTASGMPSPAAAEAIYRAAAFGEYLTGSTDSNAPTNDSVRQCKAEPLSLQTSILPQADPSSLSAQLRNLTPVDGTFDRRSLAQPMRSESFEKIKFLINDGRVFTPTSACAPGVAFGLPASTGAVTASGHSSTDGPKRSPKDFIVQLLSTAGLDAERSQLAFDHLQQQAQGSGSGGGGGKESEQSLAQAHLAMLGLIGEGLGNEMSSDQWEALGLKGVGDPQRAMFAAAVLGHDLTVMPMRYSMAMSDTRTQIGDGSAAEGSTTAATAATGGGEANQQTMDPSLLQNRRDSSLGPMRQRNWSSSGRARPFGSSQGQSGEAGPSYMGSSSSHPYGAADALRRSGSERSDARRHRRNVKSEDLTRMAQEGNADYVHRITSPNGMLAPPSTFAGPPMMALGSSTGPLNGNGPMDGYASSATYPAQFQPSPQQNASIPSPSGGNASDGTPSLDGSRSAGANSAMGSPATTWTGSPSNGSGHGSTVNTQATYASMHALASSAAAQQVAAAHANYGFPGQSQGLPSFVSQHPVSVQPGQYSQTSAPMYGQLVPPSKAAHAGMLPPDQGYHQQHYSGAGAMGAPPIPGPANHVSAATQAASAARRKTEASFECPIPGCGSTFTRKNNLDGHLRSHNNVRPFACPVPGCDKRFARRHDMNRHHDLHTNKKQHVCELCNRRFARLDALNRHLKNTNGTCAAVGGTGDGDDDEGEEGDESIPAPFSTLGSSSNASTSMPSKVALMAEPTSTSTTAGVEVAISAPTPRSDFDDEQQNEAHFAVDGQHERIPTLVTPSRQNSGASSSGGGPGGSSARFRGHAL
ncbi:hypothetical protein A4X09_0g805 [Tilletia walkeri]|uniref:C2H2-type domain-containing protein n=1 Tax=Tilletia walkeri TaxID=117179 RepID=A0A8X7NFD4_9BASI|nr:hypothetical protein A4X09_0g805 [Tilletia walkeri]